MSWYIRFAAANVAAAQAFITNNPSLPQVAKDHLNAVVGALPPRDDTAVLVTSSGHVPEEGNAFDFGNATCEICQLPFIKAPIAAPAEEDEADAHPDVELPGLDQPHLDGPVHNDVDPELQAAKPGPGALKFKNG
jgi:hypothetical protein